ncbi:AAA family ATPase [Lysinibacillus agricola]|uniref:AAA family ATPase n=1 Tax=Lysinibacillus agricola TaxID=2590012 RepID=UPI003C1323B8
MKITSLTLQAFRGFNNQATFCLKNAEIIILYGPNGHGKSSIYDAIEWVLTGGIHRFDDDSPERKRTRFIRNLHADTSARSFVKLGIILSDKRRFTIDRECTASATDRTDYGKYVLKIFDDSNRLYKEGDKAEATLKKWLINNDWLPKIGSPTTMLGLTHILAQEKIAEFLKGMQERDRYDALSILFGTDHFDKYRESFRITRNTLNSQLEALKVQVGERKSVRDKLRDEVQQLIFQVRQNEDTDYNETLINYLKIYPDLKEYKENVEKLQKAILNNQQEVEVNRKKLLNDYQILNEIQNELPNLVYLRKEQKAILHEQQQLQDFRRLSLSKMKIEKLLTDANEVHEQGVTIQKSKWLKDESIARVDSLTEQRTNLLAIIEAISIQTATSGWRKQIEFLSDIKLKMENAHYQIIHSLFSDMVKEHEFVEEKKSIQKGQLTQLKTLEESINQIKDTRNDYNSFLSSLSHYISTTSEVLDCCPACGTEGIRKEDILQNIQQQQLKINENLPMLVDLNLQIQQNLKVISNDIDSANKRISELQIKIQDMLDQFKNKLKAINITISTEKQTQLNLQQKIDTMKLNIHQFEEDCKTLGIKNDINIEVQLEMKYIELSTKIKDVLLKRIPEAELEYLPEQLRLRKFDISNIEENEYMLQQTFETNEREIHRIGRLSKSLETIETDLEESNLNENHIAMKMLLGDIEQKLEKFNIMENANIKLRSMIEFNTEKMRLIQLQKQLEEIKNQVSELEAKEIKMKKDSDSLLELINKSPEAVSSLNEEVFLKLKETIQTIFEQLNSHPLFTKLDLVLDRRYNNNCLTINVSKTNEEEKVTANAPYVFSSAQVNSIALSLFLAMSLKQKWSSLQLIGMDDPIQSMDEINVISFIDLLRLFVEKHQKQIIISTHDQGFYNMMLKKFRYYDLATIEYSAYGDQGPTFVSSDDKSLSNSEFRPRLDYNEAMQTLIQLDRNE